MVQAIAGIGPPDTGCVKSNLTCPTFNPGSVNRFLRQPASAKSESNGCFSVRSSNWAKAWKIVDLPLPFSP